MTTKTILDNIKQAFNITNYWLEKFFNVNHSLLLRYSKGLSEARFSEVQNWLDKLGLCIIGNNLFFKTNLSKPIDNMPQWYLTTKFNSILDNKEWKQYGQQEEKDNGHIIFWPKHTT